MPLRDAIDPRARALSLGYHREHGDPSKRTCRWCGGPVPKNRRSWCGPACVHEALLRAQPGYARRKVLERDRGICAACGLDCCRLERLADRLLKLSWAEVWVRQDNGRMALNPWVEQTDGALVRKVPHPAAEKRRRDLEILLAILSLWAGHDLRKWTRTWSRGTGAGEDVRLKHSLWQADHVTPVVEGGGCSGLDNLRTLCLRCHKGATAKLAQRRRR